MNPGEGNNSEQIAPWMGQLWRGLLQQEPRLTRSLIDCGMSAHAAAAVSLIAKLALGGMIICIIAGVVIAQWIFAVAAVSADFLDSDLTPAPPEDPEPTDHRDSLFYHPINYNEDPDPRFRGQKGPFESPLRH